MASKTTYTYKLFRVKRNDGRTTTVSMTPELATRACRVLGDLNVVKSLVKQAAFEYDEEVAGTRNCSGYVSRKVQEALEKRAAPALAAA